MDDVFAAKLFDVLWFRPTAVLTPRLVTDADPAAFASRPPFAIGKRATFPAWIIRAALAVGLPFMDTLA